MIQEYLRRCLDVQMIEVYSFQNRILYDVRNVGKFFVFIQIIVRV